MPEHDITPTGVNAEDLLIELRTRAEALERELTEVQRKAEQRLIYAELKAEAVRAGIVDPEGLKLLDFSAAKLNESGQVENAASMIAEMKQARPWLFPSRSSSPAAVAPMAPPPRPKLATEMSVDEWRAARSALLNRRV